MSDQENEGSPTPVPVRVAVARQKAAVRAAEAARREGEGRGDSPTQDLADSSPTESSEERNVQWDGLVWSVHAEGLSRSGLVGDSGATLVDLTFQPPPDSERTARRGLVPGRTLAELSDFQLEVAIDQGRDVS